MTASTAGSIVRSMRARLGGTTRKLAALAVLAALAALVGCHDDRAMAVPDWTLITADGRSHDITLPTRVERFVGARGRSFELRTTVAVPTELRAGAITLAIPRLPALATLEVNGQRVESTTTELLVGYRSPGNLRWRIPGSLVEGGEVRLRLVVEDTWFQSTWLGATPRISAHRDGDRWYRFVTAFNTATAAIALGMAMLLGGVYLVVYLDDRSRTAYGYFAAQALLAAFYPLFALGASQLLLGMHDLRIVGTAGAAAVVSVGYTRSHLGLSRPHWIWFVLAFMNACGLVFNGPFITRWTVIVVVVSIIAGAIYQIALLTMLLVRGQRHGDAATLLVSWLSLGLCASIDQAYWFGFGGWLEGLHGASLGIGLFVVLQAVVLSRGHGRTMTRTDALNRALLDRVALLEQRDSENERLAEELRRQVGARSRQLSHALARLSRPVATDIELAPGTDINSRYRVLRQLGTGAMAIVYEVERIDDRRRFALKALRSVTDARLLARFAREAHIAAEVSHENVVAIHDIDFAQAGFMYILMDLVDGGSLKDHAARYGDLPWALEVLRQITDGLGAIHARGVVHRDLKPANILLAAGAEVRVRISDFGVSGMLGETGDAPIVATLATHTSVDVTGTSQPGPEPPAQPPGWADEDPTRSILANLAPRDTLRDAPSSARSGGAVARDGLDTPQLTVAGNVVGTPAYMAPELVDGRGEGVTRDVFALGIIAFELIAGVRPYAGSPFVLRARGQAIPAPTPLAAARPDVPRELAALVDAAIGLDPEARPSLAAIREQLALGEAAPSGERRA